MGCSFSCTPKSSKINNIRIIHLDGHIEHSDNPVTVAEITGKPPKHFLFTHAQLLSAAITPLKLDTLLEQGRVYFLLPYSLFDSNVSPVDLAPVVRKLSSIAQQKLTKSNSQRRFYSHVSSSPGTSPNRYCGKNEKDEMFNGMQKSPKSWRPILDSISERPFNQI